jgi:uncharacterized protein
MEKNVVFKSGGYNLSGVLHIPEKVKVPYPAVVMFHGFTGSKAESHFIFVKMARSLVDRGIAAFRFDFMGSGDSEGKFQNMSLHTEMNDGKKAIEFIKKDKKIKSGCLGILGLSMGAVTASFTASVYGTKALALWSPLAYPSIIEERILTKKLRKALQEKGRIYPPGMGHHLGIKFFESLNAVDPLEYADSYRGSALIVHTKDDATLPLSHSLAYFESFHKNAIFPRIFILDEGGHTFTTESSEKTVIKETAEFFVEALL